MFKVGAIFKWYQIKQKSCISITVIVGSKLLDINVLFDIWSSYSYPKYKLIIKRQSKM